MASCTRNIRTKNYQNLVIGFQVTVENVGDAFLGRSVPYIGPTLFFLYVVNASSSLSIP